MCLSLQRYYKLSGMVRNSLLCLIIEGLSLQTAFHLCFGGPLAKLPFDLCDLIMQTNMRFMYVYIPKYSCVSAACVDMPGAGNGGFPCSTSD